METPLRFPEHKAFLRFVHSAPGGGDELYLGRALPGAIKRYVKFWLPLVSLQLGPRAEATHLSSRQSISRGCGICTGSRRADTPRTARIDSGGS